MINLYKVKCGVRGIQAYLGLMKQKKKKKLFLSTFKTNLVQNIFLIYFSGDIIEILSNHKLNGFAKKKKFQK